MDPRIVADIIDSTIKHKAQILIEDGRIWITYAELSDKLMRMGYTEAEIRNAIIQLRNTKDIITGKYQSGQDDTGKPAFSGWLRMPQPKDRIRDDDAP